MATSTRIRRLGAATALAVASSGAMFLHQPFLSSNDRGNGPALSAFRQKISDPNAIVPSRAFQESALIGASLANPLDMLVIGGGATGSGVALDAVTRGLRVGLVERDDFSSGTSSRSTKLIHGGIICLCNHVLIVRLQIIFSDPNLVFFDNYGRFFLLDVLFALKPEIHMLLSNILLFMICLCL